MNFQWNVIQIERNKLIKTEQLRYDSEMEIQVCAFNNNLNQLSIFGNGPLHLCVCVCVSFAYVI